MSSSKRVLLLTRYGRLGASSRLRSLQYLPALQKKGIEVTLHPFISDELLRGRYAQDGHSVTAILKAYWRRLKILNKRKNFDLIWIEKEALPWLPFWFERAMLNSVPYLVDYDDAIFHKYDIHPRFLVRMLLGQRIDSLMKNSSLVICGNRYLKARASNAGASWIELLPTVVDLDRYSIKDRSKLSCNPCRIVWIGSPSTVKYLVDLQVPLQLLAKRFKFELHVIGGVVDFPGVEVLCIPWTESTEAALIARCDIGIMPLRDSLWERGKCGYKLIQYMACGLPVVASPVGVNTEIVEHGVNGFLVKDVDEWVEALAALIADPATQESMGLAGRAKTERHYSLKSRALDLVDLISRASEIKKIV